MKALSRILAVTALAVLTPTLTLSLPAAAHAVELRYTWKVGDLQRFEATARQTVETTMPAGGMGALPGMPAGMTMGLPGGGLAIGAAGPGGTGGGTKLAVTVDTRTTFALKIDKVGRNGDAEATVSIEAFEVKDPSGRVLAGLAGVPAGALRNQATIDRKGRFAFKEVVQLLVDDQGGATLVSARATALGGEATARQGDEQVTVYARFDPRTGKPEAGVQVQKLGASKARIAVRPDARRVDLLPVQFLELLRLPDGDVQADQLATVQAPMASMRMQTRATKVTARQVTLQLTLQTQVDTAEAGAAAGALQVEHGDDGVAVAAPMPGMAGMPGTSGMAGVPGGAAAPMPKMAVDGTFHQHFDVAAGALLGVDGQITMDMQVPGAMAVKTSLQLQMTRK